MAITLHDLVGIEDRRFSPYCWRIRMAIAHKGLACDARPTAFGQIKEIADGQFDKLPVIEDGDRLATDSFPIAEYLEDNYPDQASLFGGIRGRSAARFFNAWVGTAIVPLVPGLIIRDVHDHVLARDKEYFRRNREQRFSKTLEDMQQGRDARRPAFRQALAPARLLLADQPFIGGESPLYVDYQLFSVLQWARVTSAYPLLETDDPVFTWFSRCLDLYDGLGRTTPGYWG